jgi:hypothetical protein
VDTEHDILDLLPSEPIYSPAFDWKGQKLKFRLMSSLDETDARMGGQKWAKVQLQDKLDLSAVEALQLMETGYGADMREDCEHIARLYACLCDEQGGPVARGSDVHDSYRRLAVKFNPLERQELIAQYLDFLDEYDPSQLDDEQIEEMIAEAGKSQDVSPLRQYGSSALRISLLITAHQLADALARLAVLEEEKDLAARVEHLEAALEHVTSQMNRSSAGSESPSSSAENDGQSDAPSE